MIIIILIKLLLLVSQSGIPASGAVTGIISWDGSPRQMLEVFLYGSGFSSSTDIDGRYFIDDVPAGDYQLIVHVMDIKNIIPVDLTIIPNDTLILDVNIDPRETPPWPEVDTSTYIKVELHSDWVLDYEGFQAWGNDEFLPYEANNEEEMYVWIPFGLDQISYSLPGSEEQTATTFFSGTSPSIAVFNQQSTTTGRDISSDNLESILTDHHSEYLTLGIEIERTCIDIATWGDPELENLGLLDCKFFFEDTSNNEAYRIVLIYRNRSVILQNDMPVVVLNHSFPTSSCLISNKGKYLAVFEDIGYKHKGGLVEVFNLENEAQRVFDPTPERPQPDNWITHQFGLWNDEYLLSDTGNLIWISKDSVRIVTSDNEVIRTQNFHDYQILLSAGFHPGIVDNGEAQLLLFCHSDDVMYLILLDQDGQITGKLTFDEPLGLFISMARIGHNSNIIWCNNTEDPEILSIISILNGETIWETEDGHILDFGLSDNSEYIAYITAGISGYYPVICSTRNNDLISRIPLVDTWNYCEMLRVSNCGSALVQYENPSPELSRFRRVLFNRSGEVLWASSVRQTQPVLVVKDWKDPNDLLSEDGMYFMYLDGSIINMVALHVSQEINSLYDIINWLDLTF